MLMSFCLVIGSWRWLARTLVVAGLHIESKQRMHLLAVVLSVLSKQLIGEGENVTHDAIGGRIPDRARMPGLYVRLMHKAVDEPGREDLNVTGSNFAGYRGVAGAVGGIQRGEKISFVRHQFFPGQSLLFGWFRLRS